MKTISKVWGHLKTTFEETYMEKCKDDTIAWSTKTYIKNVAESVELFTGKQIEVMGQSNT